MRVLLDNELCDVNPDTVGEAIAAAANIAAENGRMVVEIVVDGAAWGDAQLDDEAAARAKAQEVALTTADPLQLVRQTFRDASAMLTEANRLQQSAAELLQTDSVAKAMEDLQQAISIWINVQQAISMGLQVAPLELESDAGANDAAGDEDDRGNRSFKEMVNQLNAQLQSMHTALERRDTSALADHLMYEMPAVVTRWQDFLEDLDSQLPAQA